MYTYSTRHTQRCTCEQILSEHTHHQVRVLGGNCISRASGCASTCITLTVKSTYANDVKIIASFYFHVILGIISRDEHIGTFGSGILGNIVVLCDNVTMREWRCKYVNLFT